MFWGLIMEPNKRYTQIVEKSFHVSMASLDASTADDDIVQVMLCYDSRNYLLCSLKRGNVWQVPLDLNFQEGTKIAFTSNGLGHVHLTGYLVPEEDDLDLDELEEEEDDLDLDELGEEKDDEVPQLVAKQTKRKASNSPKELNANSKRSKRVLEEAESSEDDEDEDEEIEADDDSEEDEEEVEAEDDDEEDDDDDDDSEEEQEEVKPAPKKNKQNQQQQQQQKLGKQDKQKLVNGKNSKPEEKQQDKPQKKNKGDQQQQNNQQEPKKRVLPGGLQVEDLKVGSGVPAKSGKFVSVYYVGRLKNGKKFDSCNQGDGFKFRIGKNEVIQGWDMGIAGMKVGGRRRLTIPSALAYGTKGSPPVIPPNAQLIFEVELKNVH